MVPAKKRKVRDNEDSNGRENKEEKVVVGRYTFNRYLKTQAEERNIKIDNEFRKAIALKWHTLDPTEKAKFFVPSAHASNATPKANEDLSKCSATLLTRCSPQRFHDIVSRFSEDQINAIKEMGFGTLVQLSCTRLRRDFCRLLIDNFNTEACTIELHGKTRKISSSDFERIMCVPEGGSSVDFRGSIEDDDVKPWHDFYFGTSEYISIAGLIKKLEEAKTVDDNFRVGFMLLAIGILLCPNTSINIHSKYLIPLRDPKRINSLNWASFWFKFLVDGVRSFKQKKSRYLCGCVLFFQLYYYNSIAHGRTIIDCSKPVVAAWEDVKSSKLLKWISRKGGLQSSAINLVSNIDGVMGNKHGVEDAFPVRADVELLKNVVSRIEKSVEELKNIVVDTVPTKVVEELRGLKEFLKSLKVGVNDGVEKEEEDIEQQNGDTFANQKHYRHMQSPDRSSCQMLSPDNRPQYTEANEPQVCIKNIKKEISSPELSPDPLLECGDKIERLTAQLLHEKPRKIQDIGPFKGCRDLSNEEVDLISFIYLEVWNEDFVVFQTKNETLDRKEIRCLEPGALVSNLVVNAALSTIRKPESSNWFCTTYFSVRAIQAVEEGGDALSEFGSTARKRFAPIFGEAKLMDCDMIFIPILDESTEPKHWFLMVVNIPSTEVEIWDTYPSTRTEARTNLVHRLMWAFNAIFEAEINVSFTKKWSFCSFRVRHPYHVPKQHNSFDCGIYMIKFMLDYENAYQIGDEFDSVNERVQLALRLLKHPNNLALSEIEKGMQSEESSTKVMQPEESEESRGTSFNRNTKTLQQLDETLQNHANGNNDKRKVIKKESKLQKELPFQPAKRGRGRPLGSKNKSKKTK